MHWLALDSEVHGMDTQNVVIEEKLIRTCIKLIKYKLILVNTEY